MGLGVGLIYQENREAVALPWDCIMSRKRWPPSHRACWGPFACQSDKGQSVRRTLPHWTGVWPSWWNLRSWPTWCWWPPLRKWQWPCHPCKPGTCYPLCGGLLDFPNETAESHVEDLPWFTPLPWGMSPVLPWAWRSTPRTCRNNGHHFPGMPKYSRWTTTTSVTLTCMNVFLRLNH